MLNEMNMHAMHMDDVKGDNTILKERVKRLEELVQSYAGESRTIDKSNQAIAPDSPSIKTGDLTHDFLTSGVLSGKSEDPSEDHEHYRSLTSWDAILQELDELKLVVNDTTLSTAFPSESREFRKSVHGDGPFFGSPQQTFPVLLSCLPAREHMDSLLAQYFSSYHTIYPIIDPKQFRGQYQSFMSNYDDPAMLALLFSMLALATVNQNPENTTSDGFARYALQALQVSEFVTNFNITTLTTMINMIFYYMRERSQLTFAWIVLGLALQIARALGLHRDPTTFGITGQECQTRRHIWTALLVQDAMAAARYGRTTVIDIDEWDTKPPMSPQDPDAQLFQSIPALFSYAKQQVSINVAKAFKLMFRPRARPSYPMILDMDADIRTTHAALPNYAPAGILPSDRHAADSGIAAQWLYRRYTLFTLAHTLIVIHRPFFIKKSRDFHQSRITCLQEARNLANIAIEMEEHLQHNTMPGLARYAWHVRESAKIAYLPAAILLCVGFYIADRCDFDPLPADAPVATSKEDSALIEQIIDRLQAGTHAHNVIVQLYHKVKVSKIPKASEPATSPVNQPYNEMLNITNNLATGVQCDWNQFMSSASILGSQPYYAEDEAVPFPHPSQPSYNLPYHQMQFADQYADWQPTPTTAASIYAQNIHHNGFANRYQGGQWGLGPTKGEQF